MSDRVNYQEKSLQGLNVENLSQILEEYTIYFFLLSFNFHFHFLLISSPSALPVTSLFASVMHFSLLSIFSSHTSIS